MASDYEAIRHENIRGYGEYTHHLEFLGRLYSDRTHFIYELLQNSEDAGATKVEFTLLAHCLEIRHDGRPFNLEDVRGICGVGKGTKAEDLTQIGKFGIGFKSVYAYTNTPEIHSVGGPDGREDFCIKHHVRPEEAVVRDPGEGWTTLIVMPFDHSDVTAEDAKSQISRRLRELNVRTLLFLRNIEEVSYSDDSAVGGPIDTYLRGTQRVSSARHVTVMGTNNGEIESESWYIFDQPISLEEEQKDVYVEIAFQCVVDEKTKRETLVPISRSPLVVFFPTDKETALGFLIQGPYRTTPARDNVPLDNEWNANLVHKTAKLVVDALEGLKGMGLLSVDVLTALPINRDRFPPSAIFRPIYDEVRTALRHKPLLPTDDGSYVSGNTAKLGRGESLRKLLSPAQLSQLYGDKEPIQWLHGEITSDRTPTLRNYLVQDLSIIEITPDRLAQDITTVFLTEQDDDWVVRLYCFLKEQEALWRQKRESLAPGPLRSKAIIRLEDGRHVAPFTLFNGQERPNAFLSGNGIPGEYPTVLTKAVEDPDALGFLQRLGIRKVDQEDAIQRILDSYYRQNTPNPTPEQHIKHIALFVSWYKKNRGTDLFKDAYLLTGEDGEGFYQPKDCFLDLPYEDTRLSCVFDETRVGDAAWMKTRIASGYSGIEGFVEFAKAMGVSYKLEVTERKVDRSHPYSTRLLFSFGSARRTKFGVSEDYWIEGLDTVVSQPRNETSQLVWDCVRNADSKVLQARYSPNGQSDPNDAPSSLVHTLKDARWIPAKDGIFRTPCKMTKDLLLDDFLFDDRNGWLTAIGFGEDAKQSESNYRLNEYYARSLGIKKPELIDLIKQIQDDKGLLSEIISVVKSKQHRAEFPVRQVKNPDRRAELIAQEHEVSSNKTYEHRTHSVRTSEPEIKPDVWLRNQYTNDNGEMVCQICHDEMPFRKRDGEYYFEAVEMLSREDFQKEHAAQYIAVCPLCSAKYKEFVKRDASTAADMRRKLVSATKPEVAVAFGEEEVVIRFVETHWHDLRHILRLSPQPNL